LFHRIDYLFRQYRASLIRDHGRYQSHNIVRLQTGPRRIVDQNPVAQSRLGHQGIKPRQNRTVALLGTRDHLYSRILKYRHSCRSGIVSVQRHNDSRDSLTTEQRTQTMFE
jgi:hypothetical protein